VVLEVSDDLFGENAGRWRLHVNGGAAACERTSAEPDVALGIADLGAAYLGGTLLGSLAEAGGIREVRPGALTRLTAAMSWAPAPWCPTIF
jgi:predicted acetyltransferase